MVLFNGSGRREGKEWTLEEVESVSWERGLAGCCKGTNCVLLWKYVISATSNMRFADMSDSRTKPLIQWKLVERGQDSPPDALAIGHETDGQLLYAARAWFNGGVHLGK